MHRRGGGGSSKWGEGRDVPRQVGVGIGGPLYDALFSPTWQIFWKVRTTEAGILEVNFICRTPHSAPLTPHRPEVMEVFGRVCNHVEGPPEFVSGSPRWRYWVLALSSKVCRIQSLLLGPTTECGCNPWLNPGDSCKVYEALREWLERLDKCK